MIIYTSRPRQGRARKAWDKFVKKWNGAKPKEMYYTNTYDWEFKGWVCEWDIKDPCIKHLGYSASKCHDFYISNEL